MPARESDAATLPCLASLKQPKGALQPRVDCRNAEYLTAVFYYGPFNVAAFFENDLAVTGRVGSIDFCQEPLPFAYSQLLEAFLPQADKVLRDASDPAMGAAAVTELYREYSVLGLGLHELAERTILADESRHTAGLFFAHNYQFTLAYTSGLLHGLGERGSPVRIDRNLGGMESYVSFAPDASYRPSQGISRALRSDPSRGRSYSAKVEQREDNARLETLMACLLEDAGAGGEDAEAEPTQGNDGRTPKRKRAGMAHGDWNALADALRTSPPEAKRLLAEAAAALKASVLESARDS